MNNYWDDISEEELWKIPITRKKIWKGEGRTFWADKNNEDIEIYLERIRRAQKEFNKPILEMNWPQRADMYLEIYEMLLMCRDTCKIRFVNLSEYDPEKIDLFVGQARYKNMKTSVFLLKRGNLMMNAMIKKLKSKWSLNVNPQWFE